MVYKQFAGSSRIKNWINDNQQLLINRLINKTIHVSQSARLYCYTSLLDITLLHFARVVDDAKCIVVTRICLCVSVCLCDCPWPYTPTLLHGPGRNLGRGRGCPLVVHYWADLQSVHGLRCYMAR